jgi:hypothetical protein
VLNYRRVANAIGILEINFEYRQRYRFYLSYWDQTTHLESTIVENINMFPSKNYQSSSKVSKYDHNIMTCVYMRVQREYNTFIVFIQTINMISK